jgi:translation initiation factor RLI1
MGKFIVIDFKKCNPHICDPENGLCAAAAACSHHLLEQEEAFGSPMLLSSKMCVACSDCSKACPLGAISVAT